MTRRLNQRRWPNSMDELAHGIDGHNFVSCFQAWTRYIADMWRSDKGLLRDYPSKCMKFQESCQRQISLKAVWSLSNHRCAMSQLNSNPTMSRRHRCQAARPCGPRNRNMTPVFNNGWRVLRIVGVRQGECLSPFLFSMYINDLPEYLVSESSGV